MREKNKMKAKYIYEDGKKFWDCGNGVLIREHDENFFGARFDHKRCPFCQRITSMHILHWLNHLEKCAPQKYSIADLCDLRYRKIGELNYKRLGREMKYKKKKKK
jgi:hypothetical protein